MKIPMTLYALILISSYLYLPIVGEEVVLPYGIMLIGGINHFTLNSLLGVPGIMMLLMANIFPFYGKWRALLDITGVVLMTLSIMFLFIRDPSHNTWNTFTNSRLSYVFYLLYTAIAVLFIRRNMKILEAAIESSGKT